MKDSLLSVEKIKNYFKKPNAFLVPIILVILLAIAAIINIYIKLNIAEKSILPLAFSAKASTQYPVLKEKSVAELSAKAAIIMDRDSGVVIFAKNENLRFSPASTAKIMTALIALDYFKPSDILVVKNSTDEGSILGLYKGEKMTFKDLLYAMLLPSANDAAFVIAQNYPGGMEAFVNKMNENAQKLHLYNTHFADPAGLIDQEDYTSAFDLARLASAALENRIFSEIVATRYKIISDIDGRNTYSITNLNKLLGIDGVNGIKTGFTDEAEGVLVTSKVENGHTLIIIVMKSEDRFGDSAKLINLVSGNLTYLSIHP